MQWLAEDTRRTANEEKRGLHIIRMTKNLVRGESREEESLKLERNQETRKDEGSKGEAVATRVVGVTGLRVLLRNKTAAMGGGRYIREKYVLKKVIQIAERDQPRLALRFMIVCVPVPIRGKPVQRKLL